MKHTEILNNHNIAVRDSRIQLLGDSIESGGDGCRMFALIEGPQDMYLSGCHINGLEGLSPLRKVVAKLASKAAVWATGGNR